VSSLFLNRAQSAASLTLAASLTALAPISGQSSVPLRALVEELRIVSSPATPFRDVAGVVAFPDGRIVAAHAHDNVLRVFDSTGRVLRTLGRRGAAPGELAGTIQAIGRNGDELWVQDSEMLVRYVLFDSALNPAGTVRTASRTGTYHGLLRGRMPVAFRDGWLLIDDAAGQRAVAIGALPSPQQVEVVLNGQRMTIDGPFPSPRQVIAAQDGEEVAIVYGGAEIGAMSGRASVTKVRPDGRGTEAPVQLIRRPMPARVADSIMAAWVARFPYAEAAKSRITPPANYPAFERVEHYARGELWLSGVGVSNEWVVIDSLGAPRMRVRTPRGFRLFWSTTSHLWGTVTDAAGAVAIVRYRQVDAR
jgi:hypothetical protein